MRAGERASSQSMYNLVIYFHAHARAGRGVLELSDGAVYEGQFAHGQQHGEGTLITAAGERYVGQWSEGERCGKGVCEYVTGEVYEGDWHLSLRKGQGAQRPSCHASHTRARVHGPREI